MTYLGLEEVQVTDVREVLEAAAAGWAELADTEVEEIVRTQFRSLWYVPLLARWLADGRPVPAQPLAVRPPAEEAVRVAVVDNFGNCKLDRPAVELPGYDGADGLTVHSRRDGAASGCDVTTGCPTSRSASPESPSAVPGSASPNWSFAAVPRPNSSV